MDDITYKILKIFKNRNSLSCIEVSAIINTDALAIAEIFRYLWKNDYIKKLYSPIDESDNSLGLDTQFKLTYAGLVSMQHHKSNKRYKIFSEFRAWITLAIAIASFVKSFFF